MRPQVFGRYVLIDEIASGPRAYVYLAMLRTQAGVLKPCVVKRFRSKVSQKGFIQRLHDAARVAVCLAHPNIVSVLDLGESKGLWYVTMELVQGCDLVRLARACQRKKRRLPPVAALHLLDQLLCGLHYCHRTASGLHRLDRLRPEVHPSHVLLSFEGQVKLTTFSVETVRAGHGEANVADDLRRVCAAVVQTAAGEDPASHRSLQRPPESLRSLPAEIQQPLLGAFEGRHDSAERFRLAVREAIAKIDPVYGSADLARAVSELLDVERQQRHLQQLLASAYDSDRENKPASRKRRRTFGSVDSMPTTVVDASDAAQNGTSAKGRNQEPTDPASKARAAGAQANGHGVGLARKGRGAAGGAGKGRGGAGKGRGAASAAGKRRGGNPTDPASKARRSSPSNDDAIKTNILPPTNQRKTPPDGRETRRLDPDPTVLADGASRPPTEEIRLDDLIEVIDIEGDAFDEETAVSIHREPSSAYVMRDGKLIRIRLDQDDR